MVEGVSAVKHLKSLYGRRYEYVTGLDTDGCLCRTCGEDD